MDLPQRPIVVLGRDDGVDAFFTVKEAVSHFSPDDFENLEFFDARGRRLRADAGRGETDLVVETDEDHTKEVRERVRRAFDAARPSLEGRVDESLLRSVEEDIPFEVLGWRLADLLRPVGNPNDPTLEPGDIRPQTPGSWLHYRLSSHH